MMRAFAYLQQLATAPLMGFSLSMASLARRVKRADFSFNRDFSAMNEVLATMDAMTPRVI